MTTKQLRHLDKLLQKYAAWLDRRGFGALRRETLALAEEVRADNAILSIDLQRTQ